MQVLFARHHVRVYRFVLRLLRDEMAAEDVIGEVFLDVWRQASRFEGRSAVSTWLIAIARFKALSLLRKRREDGLTTRRRNRSRNLRMIRNCASRNRIRARSYAVPRRACRRSTVEIIDLVYYHEKSVEEVALIVGIPENTVKTRMFYARKKLGELCRMAGIDQRLAMTLATIRRAIRADIDVSRPRSRPCCRGMRPARCAAVIACASRRRCASDADIARQLDLVREELAETIHFNETLGAPAPCVADRLMAAIDAETLAARKRRPRSARRLVDRILRQSFAAHSGGGGILRHARHRAAGRDAGGHFHQAGRRPVAAEPTQGDAHRPPRHLRDGAICAPGECRQRSRISCRTTRRRWSMVPLPAGFIVSKWR